MIRANPRAFRRLIEFEWHNAASTRTPDSTAVLLCRERVLRATAAGAQPPDDMETMIDAYTHVMARDKVFGQRVELEALIYKFGSFHTNSP